MYCRHCGAELHEGVVICPECGARQRRMVRTIRCAHCHARVELGLTVCPHCGRNLRPAGPRWGWWLVGGVVVLLLALWGLGKLPVQKIGDEFAAARGRLAGLVEVLGPVASTATETPGEPGTPAAVAQSTQTSAPATAQPPSAEALLSAEVTEEAELLALATQAPTATTPAATAVLTPTLTVSAAAGASPAATPTPTPTAPATPTPTATGTPAPTPTPTATAAAATATRAAGAGVTYRVEAGDTLSTIAAKFGITWQALAAANGLTASSVLRIGQELKVPAPGAPLPPTATRRPAATATASRPTAAPTPWLPAPVLKSPGDKSTISGREPLDELVWEPVPGMDVGQQYQVVMSWKQEGASQEYSWYTTATSTRVPGWLFGLADQPTREYTWLVRVVVVTTDGRGGELVLPASLPSAMRSLYWS